MAAMKCSKDLCFAHTTCTNIKGRSQSTVKKTQFVVIIIMLFLFSACSVLGKHLLCCCLHCYCLLCCLFSHGIVVACQCVRFRCARTNNMCLHSVSCLFKLVIVLCLNLRQPTNSPPPSCCADLGEQDFQNFIFLLPLTISKSVLTRLANKSDNKI